MGYSMVQSLIDWEDEVTAQVQLLADVTRGDAQAIVEGQPSIMSTAWALHSSPHDTAQAVLHKAKVQS